MVYDPSPYTGTRIPAVLRMLEREQSWLARKMGVSQSLVCLVLAGRRSITRSFVNRACAALSLPEEVLFVTPMELLASMDKMPEDRPVVEGVA